jgi:hypothetical protein
MSAGKALKELLVARTISHDDTHVTRKTTLVTLGLWALTTGRGWLVQAVDAAIEREGLLHA